MSEQTELKPCPYCGGEAKLEQMGYPHHVFCTNCYARVTGVGFGRDGERDAINKWNSRVFETIEWHEIKYRYLTEEEKTYYEEHDDYVPDYMFDCPMPDDGDEVLIATKWGVDKDVASIDFGCFLEGRGDWEDVIAWAYMPKYKGEEKDE